MLIYLLITEIIIFTATIINNLIKGAASATPLFLFTSEDAIMKLLKKPNHQEE